MKKSRSTDAVPAAGDDHLRTTLEQVSREQALPSSGNELILLEIDPHRAHVCWNIDPDQAQPGQPLVLRVFDVTESGDAGAASQAFDVEVQGLQGRWYLDLWRDNRTFVTQLGYRQADGSLAVLAQSNAVSTPPAEPAEPVAAGGHTDPNGKPLHTDWPGDRVDVAPTETPAASVAEAVPAEPAPVAPMVVEPPVTLLDPEFPLTDWAARSAEPSVASAPEEPARAPASVVPAALVDAAGSDDASVEMSADVQPAVLAAGDAAVAFDDDVMSGPAAAFPDAEALASAVQENRGAIDAFYEAMETRAEAAGVPASESTGSAPVHPPAPVQEAARTEPAAGTPAPLEQVLGLSSLEHPGRDVLLEVNAELHIYGRSKPNTELTLYGQIVKTRPDGSFSVRRPLPHGAVILPLLYTKQGNGQAEV